MRRTPPLRVIVFRRYTWSAPEHGYIDSCCVPCCLAFFLSSPPPRSQRIASRLASWLRYRLHVLMVGLTRCRISHDVRIVTSACDIYPCSSRTIILIRSYPHWLTVTWATSGLRTLCILRVPYYRLNSCLITSGISGVLDLIGKCSHHVIYPHGESWMSFWHLGQ